MNVRAGRFPLFDSLRAIAALAVLGTHAAVFAASIDALRYGARLESGVAVFFVISGFLLYRPFVRARLLDEQPPRPLAYAWRRFLRIAPAYWVALTVTAIVLGTAGVFTLNEGPLYYGIAQTLREDTIGGGLAQAWTLTIEIAFYAFLPLFAWAMRHAPGRSFESRIRVEIVVLALLFAGSVAYKALLLAGGDPDQIRITPALTSLPSFLDQFAIGMALAVLSVWLERRDDLPRVLRPIDRFPAIAWAVAAVAFWTASTRIGLTGLPLEPFTPNQYLARHLLFALIGLGLVVPAVIGDQRRGVVRRLLANPALLFLGLISYSMYLYGAPVIDALDRWGFKSPPGVPAYVGLGLAGTAITVAIATASYYLVERPALSLKGRVPREGSPPGEAIAEPAPATGAGVREG